MITTELGGGGLDPAGAEIGYRGARNILRHLGILVEDAVTDRATQRLEIRRGEQVLFAMMDGLLEPRVRLGAAVSAGDVVGFLHPLAATIVPPVPIVAPVPGILVCERPLPLCTSGDCLFKIATTYEIL